MTEEDLLELPDDAFCPSVMTTHDAQLLATYARTAFDGILRTLPPNQTFDDVFGFLAEACDPETLEAAGKSLGGPYDDHPPSPLPGD